MNEPLLFSAAGRVPQEKKFSLNKVIQPIRRIGQIADVAGKVDTVASIL